MKREMKEKRPVDPMWLTVALCSLMVLVALGFCSTPRSIFISPVCTATGLSRSAFSLSDTVRYISTAVVNVFFGSLLYRLGEKKLILTGLASLIGAMTVYSFAESAIVFYLGGMLLGIGLSFTTTTMVGSIVNRRCQKNKGTVMGIVLASNGIGGAIAIQILTPIIHSGAAFAYRNAYRLIAVILFAVFLLMLFLFKEYVQEARTDGKIEARERTDYRGLLKTAYFYPAALCIFFTGMVLQGIYGITAPLFEDAGMNSSLVASVLSVSSLLLFCSKFGVGYLYDKTGLRKTTLICFGAAVIAVVLLILVANTANGTLAFVYSAFSSLAMPLETVMLPIYARGLFGERRFHEALGIFVSVNTAGFALASPMANLFYDAFGSYQYFLYVCIALILLCVVTINLLIGVSRRHLASVA